jgi:hypothetical protein
MLSRGDSAHSGRAERLDRCLSGEATPHDADTKKMVTLARLITPKRPVSPAARNRAFEAMMREADRVDRPAAGTRPATEDIADPGVNVRVANAGPGKTLRVADIEALDDARLEQIAANIAARLGQRAPDRKP